MVAPWPDSIKLQAFVRLAPPELPIVIVAVPVPLFLAKPALPVKVRVKLLIVAISIAVTLARLVIKIELEPNAIERVFELFELKTAQLILKPFKFNAPCVRVNLYEVELFAITKVPVKVVVPVWFIVMLVIALAILRFPVPTNVKIVRLVHVPTVVPDPKTTVVALKLLLASAPECPPLVSSMPSQLAAVMLNPPVPLTYIGGARFEALPPAVWPYPIAMANEERTG